jgi:bifunctional DNase/RNase
MAEMVPVTITGIVREHVNVTDPRERFYIRLESAVDGDSRRLDIGVGDTEAASLGFTLQGALFRRPMTYQFMASLIEAAGSAVRSVLVTKMTDGIFYAQVTLRGGAVIDARPSDAINLAAVTGASVSVASDLLELPTGQHSQPTA